MFIYNIFFIFSISILIFCIYTNKNFLFNIGETIQLNYNIFNISKDKAEFEEKYYQYHFKEENLEKKENKKYNDINKYIIVGIDFGSINTKFAYNFGDDITKINAFDKKSPTDLVLSKETKKGIHYSSISQNSMMNYGKRELNNIIYAKGIKTILYLENKIINDNICYIYPKNIINKLNIENVFKEYFIMLKNDIIKNIYEKYGLENDTEIEDKILWIQTIPSSWNEYEKQFLNNCLYKSGMKNNKLLYQFEAASLSIYYDKNIQDKYKKKNTYYILVDAGGYTSICTNKIIDSYGNIEQIIETKTDNLGIFNVTEEIIKILEKIYGKFFINNIKDEDPGKWLRTLKDILKAIENTYTLDGVEEFDIKLYFQNKKQKNITYIYKSIKYNIFSNKYSLMIPSDLIGEIILTNINKIIYNIDEMIKELKIKNMKIDCIIIAGGFSKNKIFQNQIEEYFYLKKDINIQYLSSYETVLSKGSVLYGINNYIKHNRISPITMGIKNNNKIEILIRKGDKINNYIYINKNIKPHLENQKKIQINIYASNEDLFNDNELENKFFGRLLIKITGQKEEIIQLIIIYDTCFHFFSYSYESRKEIETVFQFFQ